LWGSDIDYNRGGGKIVSFGMNVLKITGRAFVEDELRIA
jgi:hypothetical protein